MGARLPDLVVGEKYGMFLILKYITQERVARNGAMVLCKCDCGNTIERKSIYILKPKHPQNCGCVKKQWRRDIWTTHGGAYTRLYTIWQCMKNRCYLKTHKRYKNYGGRGIMVCKEWLNDFVAFRDWALSHGYSDKLTIERAKVNEDYKPSNCKWVTNKEQQKNKTDNVFIEYNGRRMIISDWAKELKMSPATLGYRLRKGMPIEMVLMKTRFNNQWDIQSTFKQTNT